MALSDSRPTRRLCVVGAASPSRDGSPPMTRITLPTCRAPYPGGSRRVPVSIASPLTRPSPFPGGSASASSLSRPAQASRALRPAGLLNRPRRPLSRGSSPVSCPTKPLVSYRSNRQLSGWNPPPLVIRAVGAHWGIRVHLCPLRSLGARHCPEQIASARLIEIGSVSRRRTMRVRLTALLSTLPFVLLGMTAGLRAQQQRLGRTTE